MKIAVDAMGGDFNVPDINIEGTVEDIKETKDLEIILVGNKSVIEEKLSRYISLKSCKEFINKIHIENADDVVLMHEQPSKVLRTKQNSSIAIGINLLKNNIVDAFVSAGNSGAVTAFAFMNLSLIQGISRPAIATTLPTLKGWCVLIDSGANVDCKPQNLLEFGYMGSVYCKTILGVRNPRVGLLSIGEEEGKGNIQIQTAFDLFKKSKLNFIGNIEGKDIPIGNTDVVVCDGFIGNVILKFGEGVAEMLLKLVKEELKKHPLAFIGLPFGWSAIKGIRRRVDFVEYGGAPLLGLEKVCIICHGRSNSKAIKNAIKTAKFLVEKNINKILSEELLKL